MIPGIDFTWLDQIEKDLGMSQDVKVPEMKQDDFIDEKLLNEIEKDLGEFQAQL